MARLFRKPLRSAPNRPPWPSLTCCRCVGRCRRPRLRLAVATPLSSCGCRKSDAHVRQNSFGYGPVSSPRYHYNVPSLALSRNFSVLRPSQLLAYPPPGRHASHANSSFLWAQRDPDSLTSRERGHKLKSMRRCLCHLSMRLYFNQLMAAAVAEHPFTVPLRIMVFFAPSRPPSPPSRAAYPVDCREYEGVGQQRTRRR